jgi:hypothetical protein
MKKNLFALLVCMAPFCVLAQLPSYLPTDGLVGWWPFNGNANDESGNGNHGTVNGATLTSDRFGNNNKAYIFDGSSDYIQCIDPGISSNASRSVSFWIKTNSTTSGSIFSYGNNDIPSQDFRIILNGTCSNGDMASTITGSGKGITYLPNNNWDFFTITYDGSIDNSMTSISIYKNSILIDSYCNNIGNNALNTGSSNPITFGCYHWLNYPGNLQFLDGSLDDIAFWNRNLSQEEITALYTATPTNSGGGNTASANVPQGISYQAVARNPQGQPLTNTSLQVKFTLLSDSLTGTTEYAELHSLTTNDLGLFTTAFGTGTPLSGTFANINWAGGNKFVKIEADQGSGFIEMGTQQMLSVPYSMRSQTSAAIQNNALPVYANNAEALTGGLQAGQMYRTAAGDLKIVY